MRPGLIEARQHPPPSRSRPRSPGRMRPGLIEAIASGSITTRRFLDLRGACAPASLKPPEQAGLATETIASPGRMRPGLIEASMSWSQRADGARSPGRMRPGLIEAPQNRPNPHAYSARSPGRMRPGLIEADRHHFRKDALGKPSPGRMRPGLIEARLRLPSRPVGSESPGRMRPGLIEAGETGDPDSFRYGYLRGACAPASLKLLVDARAGQPAVDLRGACAPASLKPS